MKKYKESSTVKITIVSLIITLIIAAIVFYVTLPAINIHSSGFWISLIVYSVLFIVIYNLYSGLDAVSGSGPVNKKITFTFMGRTHFFAYSKKRSTPVKVVMGIIAASVVIIIIGSVSGATLFRAKTYSSLITIENADFETDMPETTEVTNIALMDTSSAKILGNRTLGSLSEVVSQYEASDTYTQINYNGSPEKVANLEYNGFFKWFNNRSEGIPGYIMVDPVNSKAQYVELDNSLKYVESAYFGDNLYRKLRFSYPTKIFDGIYFEIDESGNPYYIVSCLSPNAGLFGAMDVSEVIIFNPCDGSSEIYGVEDTPSWVDIVYTGDLASQKYNWYGTLTNGFWNSIIGQKGCNQTTDDYGYIMLDDDVWYYTGVTSVLSDESNIGFIMTNARTGEYKYYQIVGAEEHSAMSAAEGEVQEKGYTASFPSLINVADQATYIMVLKDDGGLVKRYALVNVENYSYVATGETQAEAIAAYKKLLIRNNVIPSDTEVIENVDEPEAEYIEADIVVSNIKLADIDGNSYIYIYGEDGSIYKKAIADDESLMFIEIGMQIKVKYEATDIENMYLIAEWSNL